MRDVLVERLMKLDACAVSDALDVLKIDGVIPGLSPLSGARPVAGSAVTVKLGPDDGQARPRHLGTAAVEAADSHSIIVVDHGGRTEVAGWGGILSLAASQRQVAGVVIDGACRDIDEARDLDFVIYGRNGTPRTARGRIVELGWNEPVQISGVTVEPGDLILADGTGMVAIPLKVAEEVLNLAERIVKKEALMAQGVRSGIPVSEVMGRNYEEMLKELDS